MKKSLGANPILYPTPVAVVGSYDAGGVPNVMAAAWVGICSSRPPAITVGIRKACRTHANITARKAFTVSVPTERYVKETDYFGLISGSKGNKFEAVGLTAAKSEAVDAPYVAEFPVVIECRLLETFQVGIHTQFVGEIADVKADESVLDAEGNPDMGKVLPICFIPGSKEYRALGRSLGSAFAVGAVFRRGN